MQQIFTKILSRFPTKRGKHALKECLTFLADEGVEFDITQYDDESGKYYLAKSINLDQGQIITSGKNLVELDKSIRDSIYTAFNVPAYYCDYSKIRNANEPIQELKYATA